MIEDDDEYPDVSILRRQGWTTIGIYDDLGKRVICVPLKEDPTRVLRALGFVVDQVAVSRSVKQQHFPDTLDEAKRGRMLQRDDAR